MVATTSKGKPLDLLQHQETNELILGAAGVDLRKDCPPVPTSFSAAKRRPPLLEHGSRLLPNGIAPYPARSRNPLRVP